MSNLPTIPKRTSSLLSIPHQREFQEQSKHQVFTSLTLSQWSITSSTVSDFIDAKIDGLNELGTSRKIRAILQNDFEAGQLSSEQFDLAISDTYTRTRLAKRGRGSHAAAPTEGRVRGSGGYSSFV